VAWNTRADSEGEDGREQTHRSSASQRNRLAKNRSLHFFSHRQSHARRAGTVLKHKVLSKCVHFRKLCVFVCPRSMLSR
jgi:hypothetical protein